VSTKNSNLVHAAEKVPKFTIDRLRADCSKLFGVSTSTFDGATHGLKGEYTVEEMKSIIQKWMKKEVKA
jgi:hypothetical protein